MKFNMRNKTVTCLDCHFLIAATRVNELAELVEGGALPLGDNIRSKLRAKNTSNHCFACAYGCWESRKHDDHQKAAIEECNKARDGKKCFFWDYKKELSLKAGMAMRAEVNSRQERKWNLYATVLMIIIGIVSIIVAIVT